MRDARRCPPDLQPLAARTAPGACEPALRGGSVFTDDRAPVEWLIDASIVVVRRGGEPVSAAAVSACPALGLRRGRRCSCAGISTLGGRDRRRAADRARVRRLDGRVGEHDRDRAGRRWRAATGSAAGSRTAIRTRAGWRAAALLGAGLVALIPLRRDPAAERDRGLARRVRRLAARPTRAGGAAGAGARRAVAVGDPAARALGGRRRRRHRPALRALHRGRARRQLRGGARADPAASAPRWTFLIIAAALLAVVSAPSGMVLQACLNGDREPGVPRTPEELAAAARACVAAGAASLHAHPRDAGRARVAGRRGHRRRGARAARRAGVEVSFSTGLWITGRRRRRAAAADLRVDRVSGPRLAQPDRGGLARARRRARRARDRDRGGRVERRRRRGARWRAASRCGACSSSRARRTPSRGGRDGATRSTPCSTTAASRAPRLHHGVGPATWAVLDAAVPRGHEIRIGLEDVLTLPDGRRAPDNAALVVEAVLRYA